jgi:hypothetical protein
VTKQADTARKVQGIDIEARGLNGTKNAGVILWVTVKGFPKSSRYVQARHWFAGIMRDLLRYRTKDANVVLGAGLPDFPTYRRLAPQIAC